VQEEMNFHICDIHSVAEIQEKHGITKTLSLINDYHKREYLWSEYKGEHTEIHVRDHEWVQNEHSPSMKTIEDIVKFRETINPEDNVLVHCIGGVSRSPAAMLIILNKWYKPEECAKMLDIIRPYSFPNTLMCKLYSKDFYKFACARQDCMLIKGNH
jgi:predicted protein tyrosine phosphatase